MTDDLVLFIEREARIGRNPLFGRHLFQKNNSRTNTQSNQSQRLAVSTIGTRKELKCWHCQGAHVLDKCDILRNKEHEEKITIIRELKLCFGCMRRGHLSKECNNRKTCDTCSGKHHTLLHKDIENPSVVSQGNVEGAESVKSGSVSVYMNMQGRVNGCMSVVPVRVSSNGGNHVITRAFLDNGSSGTFCSHSLLQKLGVKLKFHNKVQLAVGTMHGEYDMGCDLVGGVKVSDYDGNNVISLPTLYGVEKLPITKYDTLSRENISRWGHLRKAKIPDCDEDVELLIGTNAPEALQPWELINSDNNKPFAFRSKLGWVVCGRVESKAGESKVNMHRISVKDGINLDETLNEGFHQDFKDICMLGDENSVREQKCLGEINENCKQVNDKNKIPFPILIPHKEVPDSREMTLNRSNIELGHDYLDNLNYNECMEKSVNEGYAKSVPNGDLGNHLGVIHVEKPVEIRTLFDGVSLNILGQAPGLNSSMLSFLLCFQEGRGGMEDIYSVCRWKKFFNTKRITWGRN